SDAILNRAFTTPLRLNPDLPAKFDDILNKALEKDRALRYQSASDIQIDLRRLKREIDSGHSSSGSRASSVVDTASAAAVSYPSVTAAAAVPMESPGPPKPVSAKRWPLFLLAAGFITVVVLVFAWMRPSAPPRVLSFTQISNDGHDKPPNY